jgi:regulator of sigma E protease
MERIGAIIIAILALAALIVIHEAGHFLAARLFGMRVKRFSVGFFKPLIEWTPRGSETTYSIGALPLGGYVEVDGLSPADEVDPEDRRSYANQPGYARLAMVVAGPIANFLAAAVIYVVLFNVGVPIPLPDAAVGSVAANRPAAQAGLRTGDRLLTVAGRAVNDWNEMAAAIRAQRGLITEVEIYRDGEIIELILQPDPRSGLIGITPSTRLDRTGFIESFGAGFSQAGLYTAGLAMMVGHMFTGQSSTDNVAGPVGIIGLIGDAWATGWRSFLGLMAQLSLSLCLFNFLPFPALDGGRVIFLGVEAITRRRVNRTVEGYVHAAGFVLVLGLLVVVTFRDVLHIM